MLPSCYDIHMSRALTKPAFRWACVAVASACVSCLVDIPALQDDTVEGGTSANAGTDGSSVSDADANGDRPEPWDTSDVEPADDGPRECPPGTEDCDGDPWNACNVLQNDPAHCGACNHDCLGGACEAGRCQPLILATGVGKVFSMVMDGEFLYGTSAWGDPDLGDGRVWKLPLQGCADPAHCVSPLVSVSKNLYDIATDGDALFFTAADGGSGGRVVRIDKDGQSECDIATGEEEPAGIAVDGTHVYWCALNGNAVKRASKACGSPSSVTVLVANTPAPYIVRLDASGLYWTAKTGGVVTWANTNGSQTKAVWQGDTPGDFIFGPALDSAWVYWRDGHEKSEYGTGRVVRAPKDGSGPLEVIADGQSAPRFVAVDDGYVYWTTGESVRRAPKNGGSVETLVAGLNSPHAMVVDDKAVYIGTYWGREVLKVAK